MPTRGSSPISDFNAVIRAAEEFSSWRSIFITMPSWTKLPSAAIPAPWLAATYALFIESYPIGQNSFRVDRPT